MSDDIRLTPEEAVFIYATDKARQHYEPEIASLKVEIARLNTVLIDALWSLRELRQYGYAMPSLQHDPDATIAKIEQALAGKGEAGTAEIARLNGLLELVVGLHRTVDSSNPWEAVEELQDRLDQCRAVASQALSRAARQALEGKGE